MLRRGGRNTQKNCTKKIYLHGVITHLEPDILDCEVKRALGSITTNKASGSDGIPVELFQILKDDAVEVLHSICQHIWKTQQWPQDWKRSVFIPIPKKGNAKECLNYHTVIHSKCTKNCICLPKVILSGVFWILAISSSSCPSGLCLAMVCTVVGLAPLEVICHALLNDPTHFLPEF